MRALSTALAIAACLALAAPTPARASGRHPPGATACGRHHRRRRHERRHLRRRRRERRHEVHRAVHHHHHHATVKASAPTTTPSAEAGSTGTPAPGAAKAASSGSPLRRSRVMEFDARLVQGQTAQSGAVYLFNRAPRKLPPLLKLKQSYLHLIVDPVLGPNYEKKRHR